jgi:hypothetical protein
MREFLDFLKALWGHWVVFVTGGVVMAIVGAYALATGTSISKRAGLFVLGATILLASFAAWRKEHRANRGAAKPYIVINWIQTVFEPVEPVDAEKLTTLFLAYVRMVNPGADATSPELDWRLTVRTEKGDLVGSLNGRLGDPPKTLQQGDQAETSMVFRGPYDQYDPMALLYSKYQLLGRDVRGNVFDAKFPRDLLI